MVFSTPVSLPTKMLSVYSMSKYIVPATIRELRIDSKYRLRFNTVLVRHELTERLQNKYISQKRLSQLR